MIRVHVVCEGQTEEMFVTEVLAEVFFAKGIYLLPALVGRPGHKGGKFKFERLLTDLRARLLSDSSCYCTTFFDFYGLPEDFPGKEAAKQAIGVSDKAHRLMNGLEERIKTVLGDKPTQRFIPYVQMYEFEGLLFSDPYGFSNAIGRPDIGDALLAIRSGFETPEQINDSPMTAPSKRIIGLFDEYEKPLHGALAAIEIGLNVIRQECRLFDDWLSRIEALV